MPSSWLTAWSRSRRVLSACLALMASHATGCADPEPPVAEQPPREGSPCSPDGVTFEQLRCQAGRWQREASSNNTPSCTPESNPSFCSRQQAQCGLVTGKDNCGSIRTLNCGACPQGPCQANRCASSCEPEDDATLCAQADAQCGPKDIQDRCGLMRAVDCGSCLSPQTCDSMTNRCQCVPEDALAFCARQGAQCGIKNAQDQCGVMRAIDCGACPQGQCRADHTCSM